jgi:class 3 adenylate cyclase
VTPTPAEIASYVYYPGCNKTIIAYNNTDNASDVYVDADNMQCRYNAALGCVTAMSESEMDRYVYRTKRLEALFKLTYATLNVTSVWFVLRNAVVRQYPSVIETAGVQMAYVVSCDNNISALEVMHIIQPDVDPEKTERWTTAFVDPSHNSFITSVCFPIYYPPSNDGTSALVEGVVGFDIHLDLLQRFADTIQTHWGGYVLICDKNGAIVSLPSVALTTFGFGTEYQSYSDVLGSTTTDPNTLNLFTRNDTADIAKMMQESPSEGYGSLKLGGESVIMAWSQDEISGWFVVSVSPRSAAMASYYMQLTIARVYSVMLVLVCVIFSASVAMVVIFASYYIQRQLSRSVEKINRVCSVDWRNKKGGISLENEQYNGLMNDDGDNKIKYDIMTDVHELNKAIISVLMMMHQLNQYIVNIQKFVPKRMLDFAGCSDINKADPAISSRLMAAILFVDIRGYTTICQTINNTSTQMSFTNDYAAVISIIVEKNKGFIDKFIGDGVLAIFTSQEDSIKACLEIQKEIDCKRFDTVIKSQPTSIQLRVGCGLDWGECTVGMLGTKERMDVTVISPVVNFASRLQDLTAVTGMRILCSKNVISGTALAEGKSRTLGYVLAKGMTEPVEVSEVVCECDPLFSIKLADHISRPDRREMMRQFQQRDFLGCLATIKKVAVFDREHLLTALKIENALDPRSIMSRLKKTTMGDNSYIVEHIHKEEDVESGLFDIVDNSTTAAMQEDNCVVQSVEDYYTKFDSMITNAIAAVDSGSTKAEHISKVIDVLSTIKNSTCFDGILRITALKCLEYVKFGIPAVVVEGSPLPLSFDKKGA